MSPDTWVTCDTVYEVIARILAGLIHNDPKHIDHVTTLARRRRTRYRVSDGTTADDERLIHHLNKLVRALQLRRVHGRLWRFFMLDRGRELPDISEQLWLGMRFETNFDIICSTINWLLDREVDVPRELFENSEVIEILTIAIEHDRSGHGSFEEVINTLTSLK